MGHLMGSMAACIDHLVSNIVTNAHVHLHFQYIVDDHLDPDLVSPPPATFLCSFSNNNKQLWTPSNANTTISLEVLTG